MDETEPVPDEELSRRRAKTGAETIDPNLSAVAPTMALSGLGSHTMEEYATWFGPGLGFCMVTWTV